MRIGRVDRRRAAGTVAGTHACVRYPFRPHGGVAADDRLPAAVGQPTALDTGQSRLVYQPIVELPHGRIVTWRDTPDDAAQRMSVDVCARPLAGPGFLGTALTVAV